jgi:hypothetical protein
LKEGKLLASSAYLLKPQESTRTSSPLHSGDSVPLSNAYAESETAVLATYEKAEDSTCINESLIREGTRTNSESVPVMGTASLNNKGNLGNKLDAEAGHECQMTHDIDDCANIEPEGVNEHITSILREMWNIYESVLGDEWRSLTYRKVSP